MPDDTNSTSSSSTITPLPPNLTIRMKGPGLLYVRSRISPSAKDILDEPTFLKWYDDDHIPEVVSTSGINSTFRYIDKSKDKDLPLDESKPFLAFYPMNDMAFTLSDEFKNIRIKSDMLPGSGVVYDYTDMDVSYLVFRERIHDCDDDTCGPAKALVINETRPPAAMEWDTISVFLRRQTQTLSGEPGYMRSLSFELQLGRTSGPGRGEEGQHLSTWVVMHEFDETPSGDVVRKIQQDVQDMEASVGNVHGDVRVWELQRAFGRCTGRIFE